MVVRGRVNGSECMFDSRALFVAGLGCCRHVLFQSRNINAVVAAQFTAAIMAARVAAFVRARNTGVILCMCFASTAILVRRGSDFCPLP